ncbi:uncharacterized protein LOC106173777 [Lingula anatina]|uniref:Uncharacterized protein LOC106173777 n=1 Tax=Lingula anatina TaxID=7574 RepID=A0A1S3JJA6_LINAN|nr:uncharacterized protein LOC106173777 [Lingula anatina]|eukprot:XP_013410467.1 uncharacterized protein LOC106173777 [Lingula anatina]
MTTVFSVVGGNISVGLSEEQYNQASVLILYFLHGQESGVCNLNSTLPFSFFADAFMKFLTSPHGSTPTNYSTLHQWEHYLEDVNKTYTPNTDQGAAGCVSAEVLYQQSGLSLTAGASEEQSEHMAALLVYYLVQGECVVI